MHILLHWILCGTIFCEIIPLQLWLDSPMILVEVEGAENNPQKLRLDTGSHHTYILNHRFMRSLPKATDLALDKITGVRGSALVEGDLRSDDATGSLSYTGMRGLELQKWVRRRFTSGSYSWDQKFVIAALPDTSIASWDPSHAGLIAASPNSRFVQTNPRFGFIPHPDGPNWKLDLFIEPINPDWCRDRAIVYTPVTDHDFWNFRASKVVLGDGFVLAEEFRILADTGTSAIKLPPIFFDEYKRHLESLEIPTLEFKEHNLIVHLEHLEKIPDISFSLSSGVTITIPRKNFSKCFGLRSCYIWVSKKPFNFDWITFGSPLFASLIVEFDSTARRIGFCEPLSAPVPLIDGVEPRRPRRQRVIPADSAASVDIDRRAAMENIERRSEPILRIPDDIVEDADESGIASSSSASKNNEFIRYSRITFLALISLMLYTI